MTDIDIVRRIKSRIIGLCSRCWKDGEAGAWVPASDIGYECHQCRERFRSEKYIPRYRKRRAWIVQGRHDDDLEVAFFDYEKAFAYAKESKEERDGRPN